MRRQRKCGLQLSLFVRWHSPTGKTKVNRLQLRSVGSVEALQVRLFSLLSAFLVLCRAWELVCVC